MGLTETSATGTPFNATDVPASDSVGIAPASAVAVATARLQPEIWKFAPARIEPAPVVGPVMPRRAMSGSVSRIARTLLSSLTYKALQLMARELG